MYRATVIAIISLGLTACTAQSIKSNQSLAADEGILVTTVECSIFDGPFKVEFYRTGLSSKGYFAGFKAAGSSACDRQKRILRTISLPQGSYFIGKIGRETFADIPESDAVAFQIKAGKLNYIGDLMIVSAPGSSSQTTLVDVRIVDNEKLAMQQIASEYPWLRDKHEWIKSLATDPRKPR